MKRRKWRAFLISGKPVTHAVIIRHWRSYTGPLNVSFPSSSKFSLTRGSVGDNWSDSGWNIISDSCNFKQRKKKHLSIKSSPFFFLDTLKLYKERGKTWLQFYQTQIWHFAKKIKINHTYTRAHLFARQSWELWFHGTFLPIPTTANQHLSVSTCVCLFLCPFKPKWYFPLGTLWHGQSSSDVAAAGHDRESCFFFPFSLHGILQPAGNRYTFHAARLVERPQGFCKTWCGYELMCSVLEALQGKYKLLFS